MMPPPCALCPPEMMRESRTMVPGPTRKTVVSSEVFPLPDLSPERVMRTGSEEPSMVRDWVMRSSPRMRRMVWPERAGAKVTVSPGGRIAHGLTQGDAGAAAEGAVVFIRGGGDDGALRHEWKKEESSENRGPHLKEHSHDGMRSFYFMVRDGLQSDRKHRQGVDSYR